MKLILMIGLSFVIKLIANLIFGIEQFRVSWDQGVQPYLLDMLLYAVSFFISYYLINQWYKMSRDKTDHQ